MIKKIILTIAFFAFVCGQNKDNPEEKSIYANAKNKTAVEGLKVDDDTLLYKNVCNLKDDQWKSMQSALNEIADDLRGVLEISEEEDTLVFDALCENRDESDKVKFGLVVKGFLLRKEKCGNYTKYDDTCKEI